MPVQRALSHTLHDRQGEGWLSVPQTHERIRASRKQLLLFLSFTVLLSGFQALGLAQTQPSAPEPPSQSSVPLAQSLPPGSAQAGASLFTGKMAFQHGGPACSSCHSIAGLPFLNGGTLGPDLTGVYHKLGPRGMQTATKTLYFRVMTSIYDTRPLTLEERADLVAFFQRAATQPQPRWSTRIVALIALAGFLILLLVTRFVWRDRLHSVRRQMVARALREGGHTR